MNLDTKPQMQIHILSKQSSISKNTNAPENTITSYGETVQWMKGCELCLDPQCPCQSKTKQSKSNKKQSKTTTKQLGSSHVGVEGGRVARSS